jgi:hypothetical protein
MRGRCAGAIGLLLVASFLSAPGAGAAPTFASPPCVAMWRISPEPSPAPDILYDVAIISPTDSWAVGLSSTLPPGVEHWDGTSWTAVTVPGSGYFLGIGVVSAQDIWAVGHGWDGFPFTEHYDGTAWSVVDSPQVPGDLGDVSAVSSNDVWAVGTSAGAGLIEHWDGTTWSVVAGAASDNLGGVAGLAEDNVWAVGSSGGHALAEHWDGTSWSPTVFRSDTGLNDIDSLSASDIWAVGSDVLNGRPSDFSVHWDGSAWTEVPAPTEGLGMAAVSAIAPSDVWAVTIALGFVDQTGIEHWDGRVWTLVPSPNTSLVEPNYLYGIDATPGEVWAVGGYVYDDEYDFNLREHLCPASVLDTGVTPSDVKVGQGSLIAWSLPATDAMKHSVTDASGTQLFDSEVRPPGSSFTFVFFGAGTYLVIDRTTRNRSHVRVPTTASPPTGGLTTTFTVTWATTPGVRLGAAIPGPYQFDGQIFRPGANVWEDWKKAQMALSATFTPDAGVGVYAFRARVTNSLTGSSTGWSPIASIVVN